MHLTLVIVGVIIMILGVLRHLDIHTIPRLGYQLVVLPGYAVVVLGVLVTLAGIFLL